MTKKYPIIYFIILLILFLGSFWALMGYNQGIADKEIEELKQEAELWKEFNNKNLNQVVKCLSEKYQLEECPGCPEPRGLMSELYFLWVVDGALGEPEFVPMFCEIYKQCQEESKLK